MTDMPGPETPKYLTDRHLWTIACRFNVMFGWNAHILEDERIESAASHPLEAIQNGEIAVNALFETAALYAEGILIHRPFSEANVQAAIEAAIMFLALNDIRVTASNRDLIQLANREDLTIDEMAQFLSSNSEAMPVPS